MQYRNSIADGRQSAFMMDVGTDPSLRESDVKKQFRGRVIERWIADPAGLALGITSLRLRAAVFPMEPFTADHEQLGEVLSPILDSASASEELHTAAYDLGGEIDGMRPECQRADVVASTVSLLYYPFWYGIVGTEPLAWDAVNGEPEPLCKAVAAASPAARHDFDDLKVVRLICQSCGKTLTPGNRTVVLPCRNCGTFWVAEKEGLRPFAASYARPQIAARDRERVWLPFWQVDSTVRYRGRQARKVGDLRDVLGVHAPPSRGSEAHPDTSLSYFVPAYGALRAPRLDFAARDMTRFQPRLEAGDFTGGELFNCFYAPEDAKRLAYVVWLQHVPVASPGWIRSLRVQPADVRLWYVPFAAEGRELRSLLNGIRYDRSAFRGVGH